MNWARATTGDDMVGKSGLEAAFEKYLKGTDGYRIVSTNSDGKVTGEYYSNEPQPGKHGGTDRTIWTCSRPWKSPGGVC